MQITKQRGKAPILRNLPSRLLAQTAALVARIAGEALANVGGHQHQFAVLATLEAFGPASQAELCRRTDIDRSDMNAALKALESEGAVKRAIDPANRRQNVVELTNHGRQRFFDLRDRLEAAQKRALVSLSVAEQRELRRLLHRLHDHLASEG